MVEKLKANYYYIFLLLFFLFICLGVVLFFYEGIRTSHFFAISVEESNKTTLTTTAHILGQYKTIGEGFFVGKKITISALLYLKDIDDYNWLKNLPENAKLVFIKNSESPEHAKKDISKPIEKGEVDEAFINQGTLRMIKFYDDKKTVVLQGDVVFTREGQITFGLPLNSILKKYNLKIEGINIAPSYTKHQIKTNKIILLLSFLTVSVAFLSLFFGLSKKSRNNR